MSSNQSNNDKATELAKAEYLAINALSKEQMSKYNKIIFYFLEHAGNCKEGVVELSLTNNAIELNETLPKIEHGFLPGLVEQLHLAKKILEKAIPLSKDENIRVLLTKNLDEINAFYKRFETYIKQNYPQFIALSEPKLANSLGNEDNTRTLYQRILNPNFDPSTQKEFKQLTKKLTSYDKTGLNAEETPYEWKLLAENIMQSPKEDTIYGKAVDELFLSSVARIREQERELQKQIEQAQRVAQFSKVEKQSKREAEKKLRDKLMLVAGSIIDSNRGA